MHIPFDIWKVLAGVAIFLLGIKFLEESLQRLSGRRFKLFLKKQTSNKLKAIGGGAIVTGVLQSSSVVSLMVLAFVGAGIFTMQNALAVILGANLGTTLSNWVVVLVGFKLSIESFALPLVGIAGLGYAVFNNQSKWHNWCRLFLGFSLLFVGLGYIRTGIEGMVMDIDLRQFQNAPLLVFFGVGFIITALIQSSSATIVITLSALHSGALMLFDATAIVLGAEVGTTIKLFVASFKGLAAKRRIALGNFMFNIINVAIVLVFLLPLNKFITDVIGIEDNLIALVFFQSLVNVIGIMLFYPSLRLFTRFLEKRFRDRDNETMFIHTSSPAEISTDMLAMEKESRHFINAVLDFSWSCFRKKNVFVGEIALQRSFPGKSLGEKYAYIKFLYGEIHSFYIKIQKICTDNEDTEQLDRLMSSVRNTMYAAKSIKDALPDMEQLRNSSNDIKYDFYRQSRQSSDAFCKKIYALLSVPADPDLNELIELYNSVTGKYTSALKQLSKESIAGQVNETEITTLLNFNREVFTFFKSLLFGVKDYLYDREQSKYFEDLPGFIR